MHVKKFALLAAVLCLGISAVTIDKDKYFEIAQNIEIFANVYKEINTHYVDEVDPAQLMRTGIDAMLGSLDPYTNYISEAQIERYRIDTEGRYSGIGSIIRKIDDYVTIVESYEDSPATKAGLGIGDRITTINGRSTKGKTTEEVIQIARGVAGTEIELTVIKLGSDKAEKVRLVRDDVHVPNVPYYGEVGEGIGYISLATFTANAGRNVGNALRDLKKENPDMNGVIIDLRGNGGGLLLEAVNVSNLFIPKNEVVVTTKGKVKDRDRSFKTRNNPIDLDIPVVVLIDDRSASASEIVSGVLQDYDRAVLIGQRSFGKGLVQNTREVGYNSRVKLTTSKYYIPSGRCIQSVEFEDGKHRDIPDSDRAIFYTRNKRQVLDGGGVTPDIKLENQKRPEYVDHLLREELIFKFVNSYYLDHPKIASVDDFAFQDFAAFRSYVAKENMSFESESQRQLDALRSYAEDHGLLTRIEADIADIERTLQAESADDIDEFQAEISDLIEREIIGRYYYKRGQIQQSLNKDPEVLEAIAILRDDARYQSVLSGV